MIIMKSALLISLLFLAVNIQAQQSQPLPVSLPALFTDDYGIRYNVSDSLFFQLPSSKYHILRWNIKEQYIIARNGVDNPTDKGLYTRIDYMKFENMEPFRWGFCLSTWNAKTDSLAEFTPVKVDRQNPRKGCNGYPFSRMKKIEE
jgi:hypothetical protein